MLSTALITRSVSALRLAQSDLTRARSENVLDGAHLIAAAEVIRSGAPAPYRWSFSTELGWVEVTAEPEEPKLSLAAASVLDDAVLRQFGVQDTGRLRARLSEAGGEGPIDLADLDSSATWRACAMQMISPFGQSHGFVHQPAGEPGLGPDPPSWRIGQVWRVGVTSATGWRDDRIVRFTGDARRPTAVVTRRLSRGEGDGGRCDAVLRAATGG